MKLTVTAVDYNPPELGDLVPFSIVLLRQLPGPDRPDYWLGKLENSVEYEVNGERQTIDHVIVAARWQGTRIEPRAQNLPINIAYVTDLTQLHDEKVNFDKSDFVAIGVANASDAEEPTTDQPPIMAGRIARAFGLGKPR